MPRCGYSDQKYRGAALLIAEIQDRRLTVNAAFWDEASDLVKAGYQPEFIRNKDLSEEPKFYVILRHEKNRKVIVDQNANRAEALLINELAIYNLVATFTEQDELQLPLLAKMDGRSKATTAYIKIKKPNPNLSWNVWVADEPIRGKTSVPLAIHKLKDALLQAFERGAGKAILEISPQASQHFKVRELRMQLFYQKIAELGTTGPVWALDNNLKYTQVHKVLSRGDDDMTMKKTLADFLGMGIEDLWPDINWG